MALASSPPVQRLCWPFSQEIHVLRLDLIHPIMGGNKIFKLRYNLDAAETKNLPVLTFGGPHSNHLAAVAMACSERSIPATVLVRSGHVNESSTLEFVRSQGIRIISVAPEEYRRRTEAGYLEELRARLGPFHLIPEGGCNQEGVLGCREILPDPMDFDYLICACGTGTTLTGLLLSHGHRTTAIGITPLKGPMTLHAEVNAWLTKMGSDQRVEGFHSPPALIGSHCILGQYAYSGFARFVPELEIFRERFVRETAVELDHIYNSRTFFAAFDLCASRHLPEGSRVLIIHTGGLQGNAGFRKRFAGQMEALRDNPGLLGVRGQTAYL